MGCWLVKTEPEVYSIEDLARDRVTQWDCVRNYEARNNLRAMQVGDRILFYHSSSTPPGVVGEAKVKRQAYPDPTQFDRKSEYFDPKASKDNPTWVGPDIEFVSKFEKMIEINELRAESKLKGMVLLKRGSRLSVQPITAKEFETILNKRG